MSWAILPAVASAIVATIGLVVTWRKWREEALRRGDVLAWSNDVIGALQTLLLLCILDEDQVDPATAKGKLTEAIFETSILIERGRMFFRNDFRDGSGAHKQPAYRGYRPKILDSIVLAHQIAAAWSKSDTATRQKLRKLAEGCLKEFVSLAQMEVGRDRSAAIDPSRAGDGIHLKHILENGPLSATPDGHR